MKHIYLLFLSLLPCTIMAQERLRIVEWNVEKLFDTEHDSEKNDLEFYTQLATPLDTHKNIGRKLNKVGTRHYFLVGEDSARTYLPDLMMDCAK